MPAATGTAATGAGVAIGLGNCEISTAEPAGTNLAGSLAAALLVASLTGIPLSRSCPDAAAVAGAALLAESVPAAYEAGTTAVVWDAAAGVCAEASAPAVLGAVFQDSVEPLELKVDVFCPPVAPAAGAGDERDGAGVVAGGVAVRL